MPRRGLPDTLSMRHDQHYVDALAAYTLQQKLIPSPLPMNEMLVDPQMQ